MRPCLHYSSELIRDMATINRFSVLTPFRSLIYCPFAILLDERQTSPNFFSIIFVLLPKEFNQIFLFDSDSVIEEPPQYNYEDQKRDRVEEHDLRR